MIAVSAPPLAPASKLPPPPIVPTWQLAAAKKQAERTESIPSEWRWEELEIAGPEIDLRQVPQLCLSSKELEVTELDDAATLLDRIASGEWSAEVVCRAFAKRASLAHRLTNCITEFLFDRAFARAEELDAHFKATGAVVGPLHGLPVSLKDQFDIEGVDSTMGFVSLIGKPAKSNSVLVDMLESLGAIIICKTNVPQTLMAEESNNNIFGRTSNPINSSLISGGSSGGEGALVALKGAMVGFGTDFGGSIRKPSTYCGLYGLRPTTRRLPYQGVTNVLKGFKGIESVIGPMARSVKTLQFVTKAIVDAEPWFLDARVIEKLFADLATADGGADLRSFLADTGEPLIPETFSTLSPAPKTQSKAAGVPQWAPIDAALKRHPKMFTAITYVLAAAALASAMPTSPSSLAPRAVTNDLSNLTIAAYDLNGTVAYAVELIAEAAGQGASVVAFPGYDENDWMDLHVEDYIENSMEVNSTQWNTLLAAAKSNAVYVGFGFSERAGDYIYMGQALFSPDGEVLIHRHKLRPSGSERLLWSDGTIEMLQVVSTPIGRIGLLECWEHFHPSMTFPMQVQTEDIHIGSWPYNPSPNDSDALWWEAGETNDAAARVYAINSGAVTVMPVVGHATIFSGTGAALVTIDANVSFVEQPIIYASVNASAFNNVTYNENGEQSWGTLEQITAAIPAYVPKVNGTYTNQVFNSVAGLIATADNFTANDTTPVTTTASVFPVATAGAQAANATSVSTAAAQASAVKTSGGATISAGCFGGILGVVLAVIYPA
ncbi:amidase [Pseudohyphozyma bogoriensis]|nr:amidase [Pseudohyphozyma bogoriensis]